ncbi:hypothetical protein GIB67_039096, partial [Kingdonia uniflora]
SRFPKSSTVQISRSKSSEDGGFDVNIFCARFPRLWSFSILLYSLLELFLGVYSI